MPPSLRAGTLFLECVKCTREVGFSAASREDAARDAAKLGWAMNRNEKMICPKCPK